MKIPYLQVDDHFITVAAPLIAGLLRLEVDRVLGMGVRLFAFTVDATSSKESPPSGLFPGQGATELLEASVQWTGEPGRLVAALKIAAVVAPLEDGGLRVCGTARYKATWVKNGRRRGPTGDNRTGTGPVPADNRSGSDPEPDRETETEREERKKAPPPTLPPVARHDGPVREFLGWANEAHHAAHPRAIPTPPEVHALVAVFAEAVKVGRLRPDLEASYRAFLRDPYWTEKGCPWAGWLKRWRDFLPGTARAPKADTPRPILRGVLPPGEVPR